MKRQLSLCVLVLTLATSCVSVGKNIKLAEKSLNRAQSVDAGIFAPQTFSEASSYLLAAKLDKDQDRKKANS